MHSCTIVFGRDYNVNKTQNILVTLLDNLFKSSGLHFPNYMPTRGAACIDNVASDIPHDYCDTRVKDFAASDHGAVVFSISNVPFSNLARPNRICDTPVLLYRPTTDNGLCNFEYELQSLLW